MLLDILQNIIDEKKRANVGQTVIINYLKEYLQYPVLNFIYNSKDYKDFVFTGGSCLRVCFNAPRLSEDLDFDLKAADWKKLDLDILAAQMAAVFRDQYLLPVDYKTQSDYRVYLKSEAHKNE